MSRWTVTIEIDDDSYDSYICQGCPMEKCDSNCALQDEDFGTYNEQLANCPLKEVVE